MVHRISEGMDVVEAQRASKKTMQVGSQRVSSAVYLKARELYKAGEIGKLNMVNAVYDRQDALGAWEYTMPADASPATVTGTVILPARIKFPTILKSSSGGATIVILELVLQAIFSFTFFPAHMLLLTQRDQIKYSHRVSFLTGKTARMYQI